jgi:hypothetical protein
MRSSHASHIRPFHCEVVWNQPAIASCPSAWEPGKRSVVLNIWRLFVLTERDLWNTKNMEIVNALLLVMISWMLIDVPRVLIDVVMEFWWAETKNLHFCVIWLQLCCNCNLFAFHKSSLGYNPVDIDIVTYILTQYTPCWENLSDK